MPEFPDIQSVYAKKQKLNHIEMLRAIKFAISSEFEAIQIYQQIMESTDNEKIVKVLSEITDDEKHHVGGLYKLLGILSPEDEKEYEHGYKETIENYV